MRKISIRNSGIKPTILIGLLTLFTFGIGGYILIEYAHGKSFPILFSEGKPFFFQFAIGVDVPRRIAEVAAGLLRPGGLFVMEHAEVQGPTLVRHLAADRRWKGVEGRADHNGRARFVLARRAAEPRSRGAGDAASAQLDGPPRAV